MKNRDEHEDKTIFNSEASEEFQPVLPADEKTLNKIIDGLLTENPKFKDMTFTELKNNREFQQATKEYLAKNPSLSRSLEALKSVLPLFHVKPNNKLANKIGSLVNEGEVELIVSGKKAKNETTTKVMLYYDENKVKLSGGEKYTPYDREVYDGVVSLYEAGNEVITPTMVYRAMNGLTETQKISPQAIESVEKSLSKSMFMTIIIDYTDEAKLYNKNVEKTTYEGYLLAATAMTIKINNKEYKAYKLLDKPILYQYAQVSGQIITVPSKLLQTKDTVRSTDEVIVIRGFLLRQIEWLKNTKTRRSENITYRSIYEELEIFKTALDEKAYENKTRKIRDHIKAILEEWKEQGYIKKYEEYKERNTLAGITVTP